VNDYGVWISEDEYDVLTEMCDYLREYLAIDAASADLKARDSDVGVRDRMAFREDAAWYSVISDGYRDLFASLNKRVTRDPEK